jgi:hypothetical protein
VIATHRAPIRPRILGAFGAWMMQRTWPAGIVAVMFVVGCGSEAPHVEGEVDLASRERSAPYLVVRVVPDHPDGFDPRRIYMGDAEFGSFAVPTEEIEFPFAFFLEGREPPHDDTPFRVIAWLGDDPNAIWFRPGQTFGTRSFRFEHVVYAESYADDLRVELDTIAPPGRDR